MKRLKRLFYNQSFLIGALTLFLFVSSCKKYPDPPGYFENYGTDSTGDAERKVLIISIDGAVGSEVKAANLTNLNALQANGKYNYNELRGDNSSDASSWVSMLTSVGYSSHQIKDSSFQYSPSGDVSVGESQGTPFYPNALNYVLQNKPQYKTAVITPWQDLANYCRIADYHYAVSSDAVVTDSAISLLKVNTLGVMVVDFNSVEIAGNAGNYSISDAGYKTALENVDGYIGKIITALKSRTNYANENWLIMVTTNRGGSISNPKQGFIIASNPSFSSQELKKVGFNTPHFLKSDNNNVFATVPNDNGIYDPADNKDFTVQLQVKFNNNAYWPGFFSKSTDVKVHVNTGWTMIYNGGNWEVVLGGKNNGGSSYRISAGQVGDGKWHTLTLSVKTTNGVRNASTYTDGVLNTTTNVTNAKSITTTEPLKLGFRDQDGSNYGGGLDFYAADVEYFNVGLDAATIAANIGLQDITKHPNYANLIGFWPLDDGAGAIISNRTTTGYDMLLSGQFKWTGLGTDVPISIVPSSSLDASIIASPTDLMANMLYWLKIDILPDYRFEGYPWLNNFEREIYHQ